MLRAVIVRIAVYAAVAGWLFFLPLPTPPPVVQIEVLRGPSPVSKTTDYEFKLESFSRELTIGTEIALQQGRVRLEFLDGDERMLVGWPLRAHHRDTSRFSVGRGFPAGRYKLRLKESEVVGGYSVELFQQAPVSLWQRVLLLVAITLAGSGTLYWIMRSRGAAGVPRLRFARRLFVACSTAAMVLVGYLLLHEGAHAIALDVFGGLDWSETDLLGLRGYPHAGKKWEPLPQWQEAVVHGAGPVCPTLVGYILFAFWASSPGRRIRGKQPLMDHYWSVLTAVLLFAHAGWLIAMAGFRPDSDYRGVVSNVPFAAWQVNAVILVMGVINSVLIYVVARHWVRRFRASDSLHAKEGITE